MVSKDEARKELARRELARRRSQPQQPSQASDIVRSGATGLRQGVEGIASMFGDANQATGNVAAWLAGKAGLGEGGQEMIRKGARYVSPFPGAPTSQEVTGTTTDLVGEHYEPQTTAGEYARTIGQFAPAAATGPGGIGRRAITQALLPALGSETAGQLTEGTAAEPYARVIGALGGAVAPSMLRRAVTPFPTSPERAKMATVLAREGVDVTAGQKTGSNALRYAESELGGGRYANLVEKQGEQFTKAALKRAGITANRATPDVIDDAFTTVGKQFDDLAARNQIVPDNQMVDDFINVWRDYSAVTNQSQRAPIVRDTIEEIVNRAKSSGSIPGELYKSLRSRLFRAGRTNDPELKTAIRGIQNVLDDAMERTIQQANPADAGAWGEVRKQYRNLLTLEKAATGAGENAAMGIISPSQLRNAAVQQGRRAYARGQGDFSELARAGEAVMKPMPQSGTAPRTAARNLGMGLSTMVGGAAGGLASQGNPTATIAGMLAGAAVPAAAGRAILSGPGRAILGNQLLGPGSGLSSQATRAAIAALIAAQNNRPAIAP